MSLGYKHEHESHQTCHLVHRLAQNYADPLTTTI